ncbi:MAG: hypothetical protein ACRDTN_02365 [Mycobacterium sp.]
MQAPTRWSTNATEVTLHEVTACPPSVVADTIVRTIELGVTINEAAIDDKVTTISCTLVTQNPRCPDCGCQGRYRAACPDADACRRRG